MSQDAPSRDAGSEISRADRCYLAQDWAAALTLYESAEQADPAVAAQLSLRLMIGHCRIELAGDAERLAPVPPPATVGHSERAQYAVKFLQARALELCRAGAFLRASALLRWLIGFDPAMTDSYRDILAPGRSAASLAPPDDRDPPFLQALGVAGWSIEALQRQHRGRRLLIVQRRFFPEGGSRRLEPIHCLADTAGRFGLAVRTFQPRDPDPASLASALLHDMLAFKPEIVLYDYEYPSGISSEPEIVREQIEAVFAMARAQLDARIVVCYMDAWQRLANGPEALFHGLGGAFDLVQHAHPAALGIGSPEQNARTYCFGFPTVAVPPSARVDSVPRACFAGSITAFNISRVAWWAETARRGLPVDFFESRHLEGEPRSDQDYIDLFAGHQLSLSLTRRAGGPKIITGRTLDIPLAGGVLVEESSIDTNFFLKPGVHYVPFETLEDLAALIPALLADPERRARVREAGRRWAATYFTGDYFWAGLLHRLDGLA
jgi:hypothetical protein